MASMGLLAPQTGHSSNNKNPQRLQKTDSGGFFAPQKEHPAKISLSSGRNGSI
jgi:hypothetical protein